MFKLMNEHKFEIETAPSTFALVEEGINNVSLSTNESISQDQYLSGDGFGETDVNGAQLVLTFTGHRDYSDAAQNYIFGKLLTLGASRRTNFKWTEPDGGVFNGSCTIANIAPPSGDAGAKGEFSFEIHFNGKPAYIAGALDSVAPTVTSNPIDGTTGFAVGANVVFTFSEAIDPKTVTPANFILMKADGTLVPYTHAVSGGNTIVTLDPVANLTAATDYVAIATSNVTDAIGNKLAASTVVNFRTA